MGYPEYKVKKKHIWQTSGELIQDTPLYKIDWSNLAAAIPDITLTTWRGIIDMENFPGPLIPPAPLFASSVNFSVSGPLVASSRENFYIQLTPYYHPENGNRGLDGTIPYLLPVGVVAPGVAEIEIYDAGPGGTWGGNFYVYYELGVNFKGS